MTRVCDVSRSGDGRDNARAGALFMEVTRTEGEGLMMGSANLIGDWGYHSVQAQHGPTRHAGHV